MAAAAVVEARNTEALEEVMGGGGGGGGDPKDHTHIIKGKRTKRQRPQSPIPFSIAATHSSSGDGGGGYGSNGDNHHNRVSSPETSAELVESATEEEEEMANCLILLAQGHSRHQSKNPNDHNHDDDDDDDEIGLKFTSKRSSIGNGKVGMQAYQCKTCSRIFPSFQALGGHRTSHKKPKPPSTAEEKRPTMTVLSDEDEEQFKPIRPLYGNPKSSSKIHECSICGAEFTSGQALGGHMRRHRAPPIGTITTTNTNTTLCSSPLSPTGFESEDQEPKRPRNMLLLDLDLNLPAPDDDHHHEESKPQQQKQKQKQQQQQKRQQMQSPLVLSTAPTLVDCHY